MLVLESGYKIRGDAAVADKVDYTIHGLDNNSLKSLADGQLPVATDDLYTADSTDVVVNITLVNTDSSARAVNVFLYNGASSRKLFGVTLGAGYSACYDGKKLDVNDTEGRTMLSIDYVAHGPSHELAGADEISVTGLSGLLGDAQTPLLSTTLQFVENYPWLMPASLSADGKYFGKVISGTAGAALAFGDLVYFSSADSKWELAKADAEATTKPLLGIVVVGGNEDATVSIMLWGFIREDDWAWTTVAAPLFIDASTAGDMTETAPSGASEFVRIIGHVIDSNTLLFNPENTWMELVA